jgi:hypothetical protein
MVYLYQEEILPLLSDRKDLILLACKADTEIRILMDELKEMHDRMDKIISAMNGSGVVDEDIYERVIDLASGN